MHRRETVLPLGRRLPIYPFERFTDRAKKVFVLAQKEAEKAGHSYIGTEHLLLGLLSADGLAAKVLWNQGAYVDTVRAHIQLALGRPEPPLNIVQIIPTSGVKRVLELAFEEARKNGDDHVGTEHLLLGLLVEGEGIASHVLNDLGVDEAKVRAELDRLGRDDVEEGASTPIEQIFELRARVLVHDAEPPHRLWEGRITGHEGDLFIVAIQGHPVGEKFKVEHGRMHPIPLLSARRCEFCQAS